MQITFAAEILAFALLKHNPEIYLDEFQAWLEYQTGQLYANCKQNHTASGIVSSKKVMKAARDKQFDFCSSFCNKGYY